MQLLSFRDSLEHGVRVEISWVERGTVSAYRAVLVGHFPVAIVSSSAGTILSSTWLLLRFEFIDTVRACLRSSVR